MQTILIPKIIMQSRIGIHTHLGNNFEKEIFLKKLGEISKGRDKWPLGTRMIDPSCTHGDWMNLRTWIKGWNKRTSTSVPQGKRGESHELLKYQG